MLTSYALGMRTTIDIPDELLNDALKAARLSSKREAVIEGLKELIKKASRDELRNLAGHVELSVDLRRSRKSRAK